MDTKAKVKNIRMSPRKVRLVAGLIRGLNAEKAIDQLTFSTKAAKIPVIKLVKSAIANAENNFGLSKDNLYIKEISVTEGATLKRWLPRAHGRATTINKRTSHINLVLSEIKDTGEKKAIKKTIEPVVKLDKKVNEEIVKKAKKPSKKIENEGSEKEVEKVIVDTRAEGRKGHAKIEGGANKGFVNKMFRRKSG
jgi:large subunit ribosomal protein L22